jgi:isopenicillin-N N-acyltransferase-like protein
MTKVFRSTTHDPRDRGREFGSTFAARIQRNIATYSAIFQRNSAGAFDIAGAGNQVLAATRAFAPPLYEEMLGMAEGAAVEPALIGALNGRTEILAAIKAGLRGECSAVIHLPPELDAPVAVQTWDWFQIFDDAWLVWEIPLADGTMTKTMTEYGIVGKAGLNTRGVGLLFTILHHRADGARIGVPVHVAARWMLDSAANISSAAQLLASADVSASSSLNIVSYEHGLGAAISAELHPDGPSFVLPDAAGFIVHTNHFLASAPAAHDTEPTRFPDTLLRRDLLRRRLGTFARPSARDVLDVMKSHVGGEGAVCCHPAPGGDPTADYQTLATVMLDVRAGELRVLKGGPCAH